MANHSLVIVESPAKAKTIGIVTSRRLSLGRRTNLFCQRHSTGVMLSTVLLDVLFDLK